MTKAGDATQGTFLGEAFTARYQGGALQELELGDSRFLRSEGAVEFGDPFGQGLPLTGSGATLVLSPSLEGTRTAEPRGVGEDSDCLAAATKWAKAHPDFDVVLGLIDDGARAWPHAWVLNRVSHQELDPSRPPRAESAARYLALPKDHAGRVYLDLLANRRTLRRSGKQ